jgi:hypothetical protein
MLGLCFTPPDESPYTPWSGHLIRTYDGTDAVGLVNGSLTGSAAFNASLHHFQGANRPFFEKLTV